MVDLWPLCLDLLIRVLRLKKKQAVRKWRHLLLCNHFTLITDQRSVSFMFDNRQRTKIKNTKIECWRVELAEFSYTIMYRPGPDNVAADALTRGYCAALVDN